MGHCGTLWVRAVVFFACFCVCPDKAEGSAKQPHEGADAQDKRGDSLCVQKTLTR